jgi:hypothetical protein
MVAQMFIGTGAGFAGDRSNAAGPAFDGTQFRAAHAARTRTARGVLPVQRLNACEKAPTSL